MRSANTWVVIADAARAKILRQAQPGAALEPALGYELLGDRGRSADHGSDRPGRVHDRFGPGRHSMEPSTDLQKVAREKLAREIGHVLQRALDDGDLEALVLVAPPRLLGELRQLLPPRVRDHVIGELDKDLVDLPAHELPAHLDGVMQFSPARAGRTAT
jgi:protein required for attachment to host cells